MQLRHLLRLCCILLGLFVATTALGEVTKASPKAKEHFAAGLAHIDDPAGPKYEEAYREFKAAYEDSPTYEIAVNVGYCAFFLERDAEAIDMYELYLTKATDKDITKKKREQMLKDIQSLRAGLVRISLSVVPARAEVIDERFASNGRVIVNRYRMDGGAARLGIHPGNHKITVSAEGYRQKSWEFDAAPGSTHERAFRLESVPAVSAKGHETTTVTQSAPKPNADVAAAASHRNVSPLVYVGLIATGIFAGGALGTGLAAVAKKDELQEVNDGTQIDRAESLKRESRTLAIVSDLCTGAAVVSAGISVYLYFSGRNSEAATRSPAGWHLAPTIAPQQAGLTFNSRF